MIQSFNAVTVTLRKFKKHISLKLTVQRKQPLKKQRTPEHLGIVILLEDFLLINDCQRNV